MIDLTEIVVGANSLILVFVSWALVYYFAPASLHDPSIAVAIVAIAGLLLTTIFLPKMHTISQQSKYRKLKLHSPGSDSTVYTSYTAQQDYPSYSMYYPPTALYPGTGGEITKKSMVFKQICGTRLSPTPRTPSTFASTHGLPTPSPPQQVQWPQLFGRALPPQVTTQAHLRMGVFNSNLVPAQRPPTPTGLGSKRQATTRLTTSTTSRQLTTTGRKWSQSTQTSPGRGRPVVGEYEAPPSPLLPRARLPHFLSHILILPFRHSRTPEGTLASSKRSSKQPSPESKRPSGNGKKSALKHQQPGVLLSPGGLQGSNAQVSYDKNSRVYHLTP